MAQSKPYGFWTFGGQNGLTGAESTHETLPDGRVVIVKNPEHPCVLEDDFILYALRTSLIARREFTRQFPTLDAISKNRLQEMIDRNPIAARLVIDTNDENDAIQRREVTAGVRTRMPRPSL